METRVTINKKTGEMSADVIDGVGTACQEQNAPIFERLRRELGLPDSAINEIAKPEMQDTQTDQEGERLGH